MGKKRIVKKAGSSVDQGLKARNPEWGLRQVESVDRLATSHGFTRSARHAMPANNLVLVYRR